MRDFRDALGAELRRAAAASAAAPAETRIPAPRRRWWQGRLPALPVVPALAAVAAIAAGAALVVLPDRPSSERSSGATTPARSDVGLAGQATVLGVLRRAQRDADRSAPARAGLRSVAKVMRPREAGVRLLHTDPDGRSFVLVPVAGFPDLVSARRRADQMRTTMVFDGFCLALSTADGWGHGCWDAAAIHSGSAHGAGARRAYGLVPDRVAYVRPRHGTQRVAVNDNFYIYDRPANDFARPYWYDADGRRIAMGPRMGRSGPDLVGLNGRDVPLTLPSGRKRAFQQLAGNGRTVVAFTASWCGPCRADLARLRELGSRGVSVLAVALADGPRGAAELARQLGPDVTVARDATGRLRQLYGRVGLPATFALDPSGTILVQHSGGLSSVQLDELERAVR